MNDNNNNNTNSMHWRSIDEQLTEAIRGGNLMNLRELLKLKNGRRLAVTDYNILQALHEAVETATADVCVETCQLLWNKLGPAGKQRHTEAGQYRDRDNNHIGYMTSPFHTAVQNGSAALVKFFVEECRININQMSYGRISLYYARGNEDMTRYLLEHGAHVDAQNTYLSPLDFAVRNGDTGMVRLLFQYGAKCGVKYGDAIGLAIKCGHIDILPIILEHSPNTIASPHCMYDDDGHYAINVLLRHTSFNILLRRINTTRETKLAVGRILVEHAKVDSHTAALMHKSVECTIQTALDITNIQHDCAIYLEAGMSSVQILYGAIQVGNIDVCRWMVEQHQADPFTEVQGDENEDDDHDDAPPPAASSPFVAAARLSDTSILEYFLVDWDVRFSSNGGKNDNGDYPLHVVCFDPFVSLQAIAILITRDADALAAVDGEEGLLPLHLAANWDASLDVIFTLLQHCPNALRRGRNDDVAAATSQNPTYDVSGNNPNAASNQRALSTNNDTRQPEGPVKKKAKTTK